MSMTGWSRRLTVTGSVVAVAAAATLGWAGTVPAGAATSATLTVATTGSDTGSCTSSACATLGYALTQAAPGDTITVQPGTYKVTADPSGTSNVVPPALTGLTIESVASAGGAAKTIIDATGAPDGFEVNANNTTINGFTINDAMAAGIYVTPLATATQPANVTGETIENNVIDNADQCAATAKPPAACTPLIGAGDYGESLWLVSASNSTLLGNTLENGLDGGMLISDELGPNHDNTIQNNMVINNALGCGITLAAHNMASIHMSGPDAGQPDPTAGGVYNETVEGNTSSGNGATGVGIFNAAYNNIIEDNTFSGDGEAAVVMNPTFPGGDVNGNQVIGNTVGVNSLHDGPGGTPGSHNSLATQTIGLLVVAPAGPVTGTVIKNNKISGDFYGIYLMPGAIASTVSGNTISVAPGGVALYIAPTPGAGYSLVASDGGIFTYGQARFEGSTGAIHLNQPIVGMAMTPDRGGYWLVAKDGGIFSFGDAKFYGSASGKATSPVVGMAVTHDGGGYVIADSAGAIFAYGDAKSLGSPASVTAPIVGIAASADAGGYWLVASNGAVYSFGDAKSFGSPPSVSAPIVGIAASPDGGGYWLAASNGAVYNLGDAKSFGSASADHLAAPIVGIAASPDGGGYWLAASDGGVFTFGDAKFAGSAGAIHLAQPVLGLASV
jgi:nitrous oxidase accessory protein NosD